MRGFAWVQGDVKERVVEMSERESFDLLVIGSPSTSRIRKALTISLATYCLHHAACPVLVFPYRAAPAEEASGNLDESGELGEQLGRRTSGRRHPKTVRGQGFQGRCRDA